MSVQVGYTKQVLFGIMFLLIIIVVVEGFAKVWWYQLESCAFEDSDVYDGVSPETKRQMCIESYQLQISEDGADPNLVTKVVQMLKKGEFKRRQAPPLLKISNQAFGSGWRIPIAAK